MSTGIVIESMQNLVRLHKEIKDTSIEKTEVVKEGNMEAMHPILAKERLLSQQIEKEENVRMASVEKWFLNRQLPNELARTLTNMLDLLQGDDQAELEKVTADLTYVIRDIKEQEHLNHGLIQQSLQFVHMSLHMLQPSIEQMNYGKTKEQQPNVKRSTFDSKA